MCVGYPYVEHATHTIIHDIDLGWVRRAWETHILQGNHLILNGLLIYCYGVLHVMSCVYCNLINLYLTVNIYILYFLMYYLYNYNTYF